MWLYIVTLFFLILHNDKVNAKDQGTCIDSSSPDGLPGGIFKEFLGLVVNGTIWSHFGCKNKTKFTDEHIDYYLYNRNNVNNKPINLTSNSYDELNITKATVFVSAGWLCDTYNKPTQELIKNYLIRYDCNVIAIDHQKLSFDMYSNAVCNMEEGAYLIGKFVCKLIVEIGLDPSMIHMVGHSLGAHLLGNVGYNVQQTCNKKIDRITGLDPAGPLFQNFNVSRRLDKSDATFVDVIHSNMGVMGFYGTMGHVDYFPNCGTIQPGCLQISSNTSFSEIILMPVNLLSCSHSRAMEFFVASLKLPPPDFTAESCELCPEQESAGKCVPDGLNKTYNIMGEDCLRNTSDTKFILFTKL